MLFIGLVRHGCGRPEKNRITIESLDSLAYKIENRIAAKFAYRPTPILQFVTLPVSGLLSVACRSCNYFAYLEIVLITEIAL